MDTAKEFELLYNLLGRESHTHVTVNHELQVPFMRGIEYLKRSGQILE